MLIDALRSVAAIFRLDRGSAAWLLVYLGLAAALLFGFAFWVEAHQDDLRQIALDYLFPQSWHLAAGALFDLYLAQQAQVVMAGIVLGGGLMLVSLLLFPVKEQLSARFERARGLTGEPIEEHPLWMQALEELKLLLLYVTVQMVVLRLSYTDQQTRVHLAVAVNAIYLSASVAIDFIAPVLQRHRLRYQTILRLLLRNPVPTLAFGAIFALPALVAGRYVSQDDLGTWLYSMFGIQVVTIAWAAVAGTWYGAKLLPAARALPPAWPPGRTVAWTGLLLTFGLNVWWFGNVGAALHHKSQLLKCEYTVDWSSLRMEKPSLRATLLSGKVSVQVGVDLRVHNPSAFDVAVEDNRLELRHEDTLVSESRVAPFEVPAGETRRVPLDFTISLAPTALLKGRELLEDRYRLKWYLNLAAGVEVPIYLR